MQYTDNEKLYSEDINSLTFSSFTINHIKDYDELDIEIIKMLKKHNNSSNLVDMLIDNINYDKISNEEYGILLDDISNNKVSKIIDLILRQ